MFTQEEIEQWKIKAEKWDALFERIKVFYPEGRDKFEDLNEDNLRIIGELATIELGCV